MGSICCKDGKGSADHGTEMNLTKSPLMTKDQHEAGEENIIREINITSQIDLQSSGKGYLARKEMAEKAEEPKQPPPKATLQLKYPEVPELFLAFTKNKVVKQLDRQMNKKQGKLVLPDLGDGVETEKKPPVKLTNGEVYEGEWDADGNRHGKGTEVSSDGTKYYGCFKHNLKSGLGRLIQANGNTYEGNFKNGQAQGQGVFYNANGAVFKGNFKNDLQHGTGVEEYPNGLKYEGEYRNGLKEGQGKSSWPDGSSYQGSYQQNNFNGKGHFVWGDGKTYIGDWVQGKMAGTGKFTWADGRSYVGQYENDQKHGKGKLDSGDGRVYDGEWRNGKQQGRGGITYTSKKGIKKTKFGEWEDGVLVKWV